MKPIQIKVNGQWQDVALCSIKVDDFMGLRLELETAEENTFWRFKPNGGPSCVNCRAFSESNRECRRHAPSVDSGGSNLWPETHPHLWCCEFLEKD